MSVTFVFKPLFCYVRYFCVQTFVLLCSLLLCSNLCFVMFVTFVFKPLFCYVRYFCVQAFVLLCSLLLCSNLCFVMSVTFVIFVILLRGSLIPLLNIHEDDYYMEAQIVATLTHAV